MDFDFERFIKLDLPRFAATERDWFDDASSARLRGVVLYGLGTLGRSVLKALVAAGRPPVAIADARPEVEGQTVEGVPCITPAAACDRYGQDCTFVVSIFNQTGDRAFARIAEQLKNDGARSVSYIVPFLWKHADILLPYYSLDLPSKLLRHGEQILFAHQILRDRASKRDYAFFIYSIACPDPQWAVSASAGPVYFNPDVVNLSKGEVFLDGGAFNGDTLSTFVRLTRGAFAKYLGVEPDPINHRALTSCVSELRGKVRGELDTRMSAISDRDGLSSFSGKGLLGSALSSSGTVTVPVNRLDQLMNGVKPSFIKLDIEGAELEALSASKNFLRDIKAKLAICAYHRQDHPWAIPLLMHEVDPTYRLAFRRHSEFLDDVVAYAIPAK